MAGMTLVTDAGQKLLYARTIEEATRSPLSGKLRVRIDESRLNYLPKNPEPSTEITPLGDVLGPRATPYDERLLSPTPGVLDLRRGGEPGDGVTWQLRLMSAETGKPIAALLGAWLVAPKNGQQPAVYLADAYRGWLKVGDDGLATVLSHDPSEYLYKGSTLAPHLHGIAKDMKGHPDIVFEQLRMGEFPKGDVDRVSWDIWVPPGEGQIVVGPWTHHADAPIGRSGEDAGFLGQSDPKRILPER